MNLFSLLGVKLKKVWEAPVNSDILRLFTWAKKKLLDNSYANCKVFFVYACVCVLMCMCLCVFRAPVFTAATSTRLTVPMALLKW